MDLTCLDAIYSSSPLSPPPPLRQVPPPPPAGLVLPPRYFGTGVYTFTFSKVGTPEDKTRFQYLVVPREVVYRYPKTFNLAELDSESNKLGPKPFVDIEDARFQWAQFYKVHPTATRKEIIDWSRLVDQFYLQQDTDNEDWPSPFKPNT